MLLPGYLAHSDLTIPTKLQNSMFDARRDTWAEADHCNNPKQVNVRVKDGKKFQHDGIRIEFIGSIELFYDRGNHYEFVSMAQELASGGEMRQAQQFDFAFKNVEKQYESYSGINVKLRCVSVPLEVAPSSCPVWMSLPRSAHVGHDLSS